MTDDEVKGKNWLTANLDPPAASVAKLEQLVAALRVENEQQNLVARASLDQAWWRHVIDSAQLVLLARNLCPGEGPWLDLGSGAGFPGLVVGVLDSRPVRLVESRRRRVEWLYRIVANLDLPHVSVVGTQLERMDGARASVVSARAFAPLPRLLELAHRFSTPQTIWLLPKGVRARQEVDELPRKARAMFHVEQSVTHSDAGIVIGRGIPSL